MRAGRGLALGRKMKDPICFKPAPNLCIHFWIGSSCSDFLQLFMKSKSVMGTISFILVLAPRSTHYVRCSLEVVCSWFFSFFSLCLYFSLLLLFLVGEKTFYQQLVWKQFGDRSTHRKLLGFSLWVFSRGVDNTKHCSMETGAERNVLWHWPPGDSWDRGWLNVNMGMLHSQSRKARCSFALLPQALFSSI